MPTSNLTLIMRPSSVVRCSQKEFKFSPQESVKLILPDTILTTDQKLKEMRIMSLQKQLEYNKGLFKHRVLSSEAPEYISNLYTHTSSRYSNSRNYHLSLPRPRIDIFKTSICFSGAYIWNNLPLTVRSCESLTAPSSVNFVHTLK